MWLNRLCSGMLGAALFAGFGSIWIEEAPGAWRHTVSWCLLWASVPVGIALACIARRFSIAEGVAGGDGYDDLNKQDERKISD
jgi:hypothetical protein